jgi:hypothetical protein
MASMCVIAARWPSAAFGVFASRSDVAGFVAWSAVAGIGVPVPEVPAVAGACAVLPLVAVGAGDEALALAGVSVLGVDGVDGVLDAVDEELEADDAAGEAVAPLAEADGSDGCAEAADGVLPPAAFSNSIR